MAAAQQGAPATTSPAAPGRDGMRHTGRDPPRRQRDRWSPATATSPRAWTVLQKRLGKRSEELGSRREALWICALKTCLRSDVGPTARGPRGSCGWGSGSGGAGGAGRASETRLRGRISEVQGGDDSGFGEKPGQFQMLWTQRWPASPGGSRGLKVVVELRVDGEVWEPLVRCMTEQKRRHGSAKKGLAQGWSLPGPGALRGTGPHTEVRLPRAREARCARASVHTHWLTPDTCFVWSLGFRSPSGGRCPGDRPPGETVRRLDACPV